MLYNEVYTPVNRTCYDMCQFIFNNPVMMYVNHYFAARKLTDFLKLLRADIKPKITG